MSKFINFSDLADKERDEMGHHKIPFSKLRSRLSAQCRKESKPDNCFCCGRATTTFCNSHTLPAFVLKNIALNGKLYTTNRVMDVPVFDDESGINNTSTFHLICRECDSHVFSDYENPENYKLRPTGRMVAQMAMKNYLRQIGKRRFERSLYAIMQAEYNVDFSGQLDVIDLDLREYLRGFRLAQRALSKGWDDQYFLFFYEKLNYVVPVASQGQLTPLVGLVGEQINNVFNKSGKYKIQSLHVSIFPLENESVVMLFLEKDSNRYRPFRKAFECLTLEDKLAAINYLVFCLSEDVFLSKNLSDKHLDNEELRKVAGVSPVLASDTPEIDCKVIDNDFSFTKMHSIPNFLTMKV